jgi:hypothetical protein
MLFFIMLGVVVALTILFGFAGAEAGLGGCLIGLWTAGIVGWVANIVAIWHGPALAAFGVQDILRVIGIVVAPIGVVLGYI